jgi:SAM-dependent methyltransferase
MGRDAAAARIVAEEARIRAAYARRTGADRYAFFNPAHLLAVQERERVAIDLLRRHGVRSLGDADVLEIGCGTGVWLRELVKWGAHPRRVVGIELLPDRAAEARRLCPAGVTIRCENAAAAVLPRARYDLVLQSMVFTSILDPDVRAALAQKMVDALRPGGMILWYDARVSNPWNRDARGVGRREIARLFPGCRIRLRRVTLAAPLARAVLPRSSLLYALLHACPLLRTHYLGVIVRPDPERAA